MDDDILYTYGSDSSGRIELRLTVEQAHGVNRPGPADDAVAYLRRVPAIAAQVDAWQPADMRDELRGVGGWDDGELADDDANRSRMLWLLAINASEDAYEGGSVDAD